MSEAQDTWQENNERYLAAALRWLRRRLRQLANMNVMVTPVAAGAAEAVPVTPAQPGGRLSWRRKPAELPAQIVTPGDPEPDLLFPADEEEALLEMTEAAAAEPAPALILLGRRLGLSQFEKEVLFLCAAMELDTSLSALCAQAQDDPNRPYPTFALALALFADPAWEVLSPERPLRYWRLIEITQPGAQPLTSSALRADERIVNYIKGLNYLDDRLAPLLAPFDVVPSQTLPPSQEAAAAQVVYQFQQAPTGRLPVVQLLGLDSQSKQLIAQAAALALGTQLYRLPVELLPADGGQLEQLGRLWQRESILWPLALYLDAQEADGEGQGSATPPWQRFLAHSQGVFFLATREVRAGLGAVATAVEVDKPTPAEQQVLWAAALDTAAPESPRLLAGQFNLNVVTIQQIARTALDEAQTTGEPLTHEQLWDACLANTRPRLDLLAQRIEPKATWNDIVLPDDAAELLRQIAAQVAQRHTVYDDWGFRERLSRGLGINALFTGESGTGKTMAAEVLANELRLNLYRIDLSAVVSKYIGETEKNLRRLFDAAEDGGAILFFDEADALFGKRSEVKDSHDRYANIEVNYLLQRMEAYRGLAILATNLRGALDQAFMRRLRFVVPFPFPGLAQRKAIWERIFPPQTPLEGVDYDRLARLSLTGGSINNIALNAAFLAAQTGGPVTMPLILQAARAEMRKLERPIREADFHWQRPPPVPATTGSVNTHSAKQEK